MKGASLAADSIRTRAPFVELPREIVMDVSLTSHCLRTLLFASHP